MSIILLRAAFLLTIGTETALVINPPVTAAKPILRVDSVILAKGSTEKRAASNPACKEPTPTAPLKAVLPIVSAGPPKGNAIILIGSKTPAPNCAQKLELDKTSLLVSFSSIPLFMLII